MIRVAMRRRSSKDLWVEPRSGGKFGIVDRGDDLPDRQADVEHYFN